MTYREHRVSVTRPARFNKYTLLVISKKTGLTIESKQFNLPNPARAFAITNFDSSNFYQLNSPTGDVERLFQEEKKF